MIQIQLGSRTITQSSAPYVIAEIGVNHGGSMEKARELIRLAKEGGADAAKFQSYKAGTLASRHSPAYWDLSKEKTTSQYELFKKYDSFGPDDYRALAAYCREVGIDFLSTPFDDEAIEFLDPLMPYFKIASADITNTPFLRKVAAKGKPILLATGCSTVTEIDQAVATLQEAGCRQLSLLHCILNYPTENPKAHLLMITGLRRSFADMIIGYSDHTLPDEQMTPLATAFLLGAVVLEKHFTYDKTLPGNDHYHAMDVHDLRRFVSQARKIQELLGTMLHKAPIPSEAPARRSARRSIVLAKDVPANGRLTADMLICKRPGTGVSPVYWDDVLGRAVVRDMKADEILQWQDMSPGPTDLHARDSSRPSS